MLLSPFYKEKQHLFSDNLYITGGTNSASGIATTNAYQSSIADPYGDDAFLAKFDASVNIVWSTYFGGVGQDEAFSVISDTTNAVYITGYTNSTSGIASANASQSTFGGTYDGFLSKFDSAGSFSWGTYIGGSDFDILSSVTCDSQLNVYVAGKTVSTSGITTTNAYQTTYGGGYQDGMIAKYTSGGTLSWATYYGNTSEDQVDKIVAAKSGGIYLSGFTGGGSNMVTPDAPQLTLGGSYDGMVSRFNTDSTLNWSSYIGGSDGEEAYIIAPDDIGNLFIGGNTSGATGIATADAWQTTFGGSDLGGFIVKIKDCTPPVTPDSISGLHHIYAGTTNTYTVAASPNTNYTWILPNGWQGSSTTNTIDAVSNDNGGVIKVAAYNACDVSDTVTLSVTVNSLPEVPQIVANNNILSTTENYFSYQWNEDGQPISGATQPTYAPVAEDNYSVTVYNNAGCAATSATFNYSLTSISNVLTTAGVKIYPNLANDVVHIELPFAATALIADINGRILNKATFEKGNNVLSVKGFADGIYNMRIISKDGKISGTQKLVKTAIQ